MKSDSRRNRGRDASNKLGQRLYRALPPIPLAPIESLEARQLLSTTLAVNFAPASAPAVTGYITDGGQTYAARNGRTFGWSVSHTDSVLDRNKNANQLVDTHVAVKAGGKWELAVPNGTYTVKIGVGDSAAASKNNVWLEGIQLFNYQAQNANVFSNKSTTIKVADGRLTMAIGSAATGTTRINFIEIADLPDVPPTTVPPPVSPPPVSPPPTVPPVSPPTSTTGTVKVHFPPATAPAVSGYLVDSGQTYGARNSQTYGWSASHTDAVFDRNKNTNQLLDTHVAMKAGGKWEMAVPNGKYTVTVGVGDSAAASKNNVWIEGVQLFNYQATDANTFASKSLTVTVADGKLTVGNGSAAAGTTRVNYIAVAGLPVAPPPAVPPPPLLPPTLPLPVNALVLNPVADTYMRYGAFMGVNYGGALELEAKVSADFDDYKVIWLKFDLSTVQTVGKATLRLCGRLSTAGQPTPMMVIRGANSNWSEFGLTWRNSPQFSTTVEGQFEVTSTQSAWYEVDLTDVIKAQQWLGNSTLTLVVRSGNSREQGFSFGSKESAIKPALVIEEAPPPAFVISDLTPEVPENGSAAVAISLSSAPTSPRSVLISRDSGGDANLSFAGGAGVKTLIFTPDNWNVPQNVLLAATTDADTVNDTATFSIYSGGMRTRTIVAVEHDSLSAASVQVLPAVGGAYVQSGVGESVADGFSANLPVKNDGTPNGTMESHISFDLAGAEPVTSATLRIAGRLHEDTPAAMQIGVFGTNGDSWSESDLTWSNRQSTDEAPLLTFNISSVLNNMFELDISQYVALQQQAGKTSVTLVLRAMSTSTSLGIIRSDDTAGAWQPELVINAPSPLPPLRVMALGDSITQGDSGSYRARLHLLLSAAYPGRTIDFVGSSSAFASPGLAATSHEGHGGYNLVQLGANLDGNSGTEGNNGGYWLTGTGDRPVVEPDIILLHAGTRDLSVVLPGIVRDRLDAVIDKVTTLLPNAMLLVSDPILRRFEFYADVRWQEYIALVPPVIQKYAALGRNVSFVKMSDKLTIADLIDNTHPNQTGSDKMADVWMNGLQSRYTH